MNSNYRKNLKDLATACKNYVDATKEQILWQVGQYDISTQDDNTTAYQKIVPTGATRGKLKSIGFMSYKSENLMFNNNIQQGTFNTSTGEIMSQSNRLVSNELIIIPSGSFTISWNTNNNVNSIAIAFFNENGEFLSDETIAFYQTTNNTYTFTTNDKRKVRIAFRSSDTSITTLQPSNISNLMINKGATALPYQPYFTGIRDSIITSVKSYGANLFNIHTTDTYTYQYESWNTAPVHFNATNTYVENDTINCNSRTGTISYLGFKVNFTKTGTYIVAFDKNNTNRSCFSVLNKTDMAMVLYREAIVTSGRITVTFTIDDLSKEYYLGFTNYSSNSILSNVMLNLGSTALPYKPYRGLIDTYTIPSEIQALEGYGRGINENCYNVLDLDTKEFTDKDGKKDLGTLNYIYVSQYEYMKINTNIGAKLANSSTAMNALCEKYKPISQIYFQSNDKVVFVVNSVDVCIKDTDYTDATAFKTAMSGVPLQYELATYNITDNLELPNNVIKVEAGGYLVFENQYGQAVPSNITYRIEVAS